GAEEAGDTARLHAEGEVVDGSPGAVLLGEVLDVDAGHGLSMAAGPGAGPPPGGEIRSPARGRRRRTRACHDAGMIRFLRPFLRGITYTRQLHLWVPALPFTIWVFIHPTTPWLPAFVVVPMGLIPGVRRLEGVQARLLLTPGERDPGISQEPSATWRDRRRTALWLAVRLVLGAGPTIVTVWL